VTRPNWARPHRASTSRPYSRRSQTQNTAIVIPARCPNTPLHDEISYECVVQEQICDARNNGTLRYRGFVRCDRASRGLRRSPESLFVRAGIEAASCTSRRPRSGCLTAGTGKRPMGRKRLTPEHGSENAPTSNAGETNTETRGRACVFRSAGPLQPTGANARLGTFQLAACRT
jgi:hypothetical protein